MIIDDYKSLKDFPFERYFESATQYIQAQSYWFKLLHSIDGFDENEWVPKLTQVDLEDEMYTGRVCYIFAGSKRKEISISTASLLGDANMLWQENRGYSEEEYLEQKKIFGSDFELSESDIKGISYDEALELAVKANAKSFATIWVEKASHWQFDSSSPDGGYEVPTERLILCSEISKRAEPKAHQALELFLQNGPAMDRVNSVFALDDEQA